jgi:hypothetical protein
MQTGETWCSQSRDYDITETTPSTNLPKKDIASKNLALPKKSLENILSQSRLTLHYKSLTPLLNLSIYFHPKASISQSPALSTH